MPDYAIIQTTVDTAAEDELVTYLCPLCLGMTKDACDSECICCYDVGRVFCVPIPR